MQNWKRRLREPFLTIGLDPKLEGHIARQVRQTNFLATAASGLVGLTALLDLAAGYPERALIDVALAILIASALAINKLKLFSVARAWLAIMPSFAFFAICLIHGEHSGVEFFLLMLPSVPLIVLLPQERWLTAVGSVLPIALFALLESLNYDARPFIPQLSFPAYLYFYSAVMSALFPIIMISYFQHLHLRSEQLLKETIQDLEVANARTSAMLRAMQDGVIRVRSDETIKDFHRPDYLPLAWPPEGLLDRQLSEVATKQVYDCMSEALGHALTTGEAQENHLSIEQDGKLREFEMRCTPCDENEAIISTRDVTAQNEARQLIDQQRAMMINSARMSALGEISGTIVHEIANPLTVIRGHAMQIRENALLTPDSTDRILLSADKITTMSKRISDIIHAVRTMARNGEQDPMRPESLAKIIAEAADICRDRYRSGGVDLIVDAIPDDLKAECRHVQVGQVLVNLLNNAFDAISELPEKWIRIGAREQTTQIEIYVTDSGMRIPAELQTRIFRPFFTTKALGNGTGLGLSVSREIAETHGGTLTVDSSLPNTSFVLTLPKRRPAELGSGRTAA